MPLINADRERFPCDPWNLIETRHDAGNGGVLDTLFAVGNGSLGMRGAHSTLGDAATPGTYLNGFHETWPIRHAEDAYGFARVGQGIISIPDANSFDIRVDGESLSLGSSAVTDYRRWVDFKTGTYECAIVWACRSGAAVTTHERRAVGHDNAGTLAVELTLTSDRPVTLDVTSAVVNRQDLRPDDQVTVDPRRAGRHTGRVLQNLYSRAEGGSVRLAWQTTQSGQQLGMAVDHEVSPVHQPFDSSADGDWSTVRYIAGIKGGEPFCVRKTVSYVAGVGETAGHLVRSAEQQLLPADAVFAQSARFYATYWRTADIEIGAQAELQQAVRWNLFQLAQATACAGVAGIPAKGVTGAGYDGHYFWDQEIYLLPFLTYILPAAARKVLSYRHGLLPQARQRAAELNMAGALFPWRTINGEEASAYYAAGTAQFHLGAAIAYAVNRYGWATGDTTFAEGQGAELLIETARMWVALGFFGKDGSFHLHGVTGPDEYTAVVNDNFYTNVMARFNLRAAAALQHPSISEENRCLWNEAADRMTIPYDTDLAVHAQDNDFMSLQSWDWDTPREKYPLMLHFHPLVIYRHQVIKQVDAVLAMFLQWHEFTAEDKRRAFDFYDPLTTGDSTLSASVQGIMAAEVGHSCLALQYFTTALFIDLDDVHHNTVDGVHIASAGGTWSALVCGFAGLRDQGAGLYFNPRLPEDWSLLTFHLNYRRSLLRIVLAPDSMNFEVVQGPDVEIQIRQTHLRIGPGQTRFSLTGERIMAPQQSAPGHGRVPAGAQVQPVLNAATGIADRYLPVTFDPAVARAVQDGAHAAIKGGPFTDRKAPAVEPAVISAVSE